MKRNINKNEVKQFYRKGNVINDQIHSSDVINIVLNSNNDNTKNISQELVKLNFCFFNLNIYRLSTRKKGDKASSSPAGSL